MHISKVTTRKRRTTNKPENDYDSGDDKNNNFTKKQLLVNLRENLKFKQTSRLSRLCRKDLL